ncbi:MAG: hypothetical protein K2H46_00250 [Muribaculaceae bacterium]|nr:hypothetical protein [Muribaculaceae bacterium]
MKKPTFPHSNTLFTISWILTIPILIDICTGCNLFSFWIAWLLFFIVAIISLVRIVYGFRQKLYKFCFGLIGQLLLGAGVLLFFQLSFNHIIDTPVSDPITPTVVEITPPKGLGIDTVTPVKPHLKKDDLKSHKDSIKK